MDPFEKPSPESIPVANSVSTGAIPRRKAKDGRVSCFRRFCIGSRSRAGRAVRDTPEDGCQEAGASVYTTSTAEHRGISPNTNIRSQPSRAYSSSLANEGGVWMSSGLSFTQTKRGRAVNEDSFLLESRELVDGS